MGADLNYVEVRSIVLRLFLVLLSVLQFSMYWGGVLKSGYYINKVCAGGDDGVIL